MYSYGHVLQYFYTSGMKGYSNKPMDPNLLIMLIQKVLPKSLFWTVNPTLSSLMLKVLPHLSSLIIVIIVDMMLAWCQNVYSGVRNCVKR